MTVFKCSHQLVNGFKFHKSKYLSFSYKITKGNLPTLILYTTRIPKIRHKLDLSINKNLYIIPFCQEFLPGLKMRLEYSIPLPRIQ